MAEEKRPTPWLLTPALLWLLACAVPSFYASYSARVILISALIAAVDAAIVLEFRRPAGNLPARRLAAALFGFHGVLYAARAGMVLMLDPALQAKSPADLGGTARPVLELSLFYVALLHLPAAALIMLKLAKEKTELVLHQAEAKRGLLVREMNHRVKNILATTQAVMQQTVRQAAGDLGRFSAVYSGRLKALARAHDLLQEHAWETVQARNAVEVALAPWLPSGQILVEGAPEATLSPAHGQMLVLALHELATNAVKYGALSRPDGQVLVTLSRHDVAGGPGAIHLTWQETGGPRIESAPTRRGFGHRLLEQGLAHQSGGTVALEFRPEGLNCRLSLPLCRNTGGAPAMAAPGTIAKGPERPAP
jgi:two-component sensor histidine kinase